MVSDEVGIPLQILISAWKMYNVFTGLIIWGKKYPL